MASASAGPTISDVMALLRTIEGKVERSGRPANPPLARERSSSAKRRAATAVQATGPGGAWAAGDVIERVLFSQDQITKRVRELAGEVSAAYADATEDSFVVVGLLSGVYMFMADFTRELTVPHQIDFVAASSYGLETVSSADVKIKKDLDSPCAGKDVLIIDEMCDSGRTMASLQQMFLDRGAKSVRTCVLLNKFERRSVGVELDFVGFECEDEFVVGYGMDWAHRFRSLRDVCVVRRSAYET